MLELSLQTSFTSFCSRGTHYGTSASAATLLVENINSSSWLEIQDNSESGSAYKNLSEWKYLAEKTKVGSFLNERLLVIIIPHQKLLQSDWSFTQQHFRCLVLSPFESCHVIGIMLPRKPNVCHVRDIMLLCKPNVYHASFRKVILERVVCSDTYNP